MRLVAPIEDYLSPRRPTILAELCGARLSVQQRHSCRWVGRRHECRRCTINRAPHPEAYFADETPEEHSEGLFRRRDFEEHSEAYFTDETPEEAELPKPKAYTLLFGVPGGIFLYPEPQKIIPFTIDGPSSTDPPLAKVQSIWPVSALSACMFPEYDGA